MTNETEVDPKIQLALQFVKLMNGENILCQVIEGMSGPEPHHLMACYPIQIVEMTGRGGESAYGLSPWIPFSKQKIVAINRGTIVATTTVMESIEAMYVSYLKDYLTQQNVMVATEDVTTKVDTALDMEAFEDDEPKAPAPVTWIN
jgi:hypothetical protein